ncbi:MAG: hypothetical protein OEV55_04020 [candidate division Zixibacteria bacterium]|nr:hypothetical protein [candidate division Zixibacteria bacterium]
MSSVGFLKSKKMILGGGLVFLLIVGFFAFKLLTGVGEVQAPPAKSGTVERSQPGNKLQNQAQKKNLVKKEGDKDDSLTQAKADTTQKLAGETPLYRLLKGWRDPFGNGNRRVAELEERIKIIKMEIELLRDSLEQEKLRDELAKLSKGYTPAPVSGSKPEIYSKKSEPKTITVKAILISEDGKTALLYWGSKKAWVKEGEHFEGWTVSEIGKSKVILTKEGISHVLSYHPLPAYEGGNNEQF